MPTNLSIVLEQISLNLLPNQELSISDVMLSPKDNTDKVFKQLIHALQKNNTLKQFTLDATNSLRSLNCLPETARILGETLGNISSLKQVFINLREESSRIAYENTLGFLMCLTGTAKIKQLTLKLHNIDNELLGSLSAILQRNKSLETIDIERSSLTPCAYEVNIFINFINTLRNKPLKKLAIRNLPLGNHSTAILFAKNNLFLEELYLSNSSLTAEAVPGLNEYLRNNHRLKRLHLTNFPFTLRGVQQLTVESLRHLHTLELSCCNLKNDILSYLINHLLIHLTSLHELDLSINSFNLETIECVKQLIEANQHIKILHLDGCKFGEQHLLKLKDTLSNPKLCQLERFSFWSNIEFSLSSVQLTVDILRSNDNLLEFLGPHTDAREIQEALQANKNKHRIKIKNAQSQFIDSVITIAQGFYDNQDILSRLPVEVISEILSMVGNNTLGMDDTGIRLCIVLIIQNIGARKSLLERKEYNLEIEHNISRWWSTQCTYQNQRLSLFSQRKPLPVRKEVVPINGCCSTM